jgi:hypothetical protein
MNTKATDIELIQQKVQYYFNGLYHSDVEKLKKAFHPNSQVIGYFDGSLTFESFDGFLEFVKVTQTISSLWPSYKKIPFYG